MKKTLLVLAIVLAGSSTRSLAQADYQHVDTTHYYAFQINYWFNMHHFLWMESFLSSKLDRTLIGQDLSAEDRALLDVAVEFYKKQLVEEDLRMSDYMTAFKEWITAGEVDLREGVPLEFAEHVERLLVFDEVYQRIFWPTHRQACEAILADNLDLIRTTEKSYVEQITAITKEYWQEDKVKVDIVYYGKITERNYRNRPYTSIFPTYVVMNVAGDNDIPGNWVELLYHESAHPLILGSGRFVGGTILDYAEVHDIQAPAQLWHAYLFYFTGQLSKKLLQEAGVDYPMTYMERNKVFSVYYPLLEKHLKPYLNRAATLQEATEKFVKGLKKKR